MQAVDMYTFFQRRKKKRKKECATEKQSPGLFKTRGD